MFDDIIKNEKITTWKRNCGNCEHSSTIMSTDLPKLYCKKKERHVDEFFYCGSDYYGKYSTNFGI